VEDRRSVQWRRVPAAAVGSGEGGELRGPRSGNADEKQCEGCRKLFSRKKINDHVRKCAVVRQKRQAEAARYLLANPVIVRCFAAADRFEAWMPSPFTPAIATAEPDSSNDFGGRSEGKRNSSQGVKSPSGR
jgi:hypothetical protein